MPSSCENIVGIAAPPHLCLICSLAGLSVGEGAIGWVGGVAGSAQGFGRVRHHPMSQLPAQAGALPVAVAQRHTQQEPDRPGAHCTAEHHLVLQPFPGGQSGPQSGGIVVDDCFQGSAGGSHSNSIGTCSMLCCCRLLTMNSRVPCLAQAPDGSTKELPADCLSACLFTGTYVIKPVRSASMKAT